MTPAAPAENPQIVLRPEKRGTFIARHPWVHASSLAGDAAGIEDGQVVDLVLPGGGWVARGIFNRQSRIRVRLYVWDPAAPLDDALVQHRLAAALDWRNSLANAGENSALRLVFSEGDGLSGLIVDRYAEHLVVQVNARAIEQRLPAILGWLAERLQPRSILIRVDPRVAAAEGITLGDHCAFGHAPGEPVRIEQSGLQWTVDLESSQKTGAYLDQRDNRLAAARWCRDRRVLDVCCYTGGFGLTCRRLGGSGEVLGIDASGRAIEIARRHAELNAVAGVRFEIGDCFEALQRLAEAGERFGFIVLDPPKFAGSRRAVPAALRAYHRLNRLAVECLEPGGILVTCSCSGLVTREDFLHLLSGVGQKARRNIQVLEQRGAAADHPVWIGCPETDYLKCWICRVE